jgi:tetratricopeptide (TPR) repeat protein
MKFNIRLVMSVILLALFSGPVLAAPGVVLNIRVEEGTSSDSASFKLIEQRDVEFPDGVEKASFQTNFTLTVTPHIIDQENLILNLNLITLPPRPQTILREVLAKSGQRFYLDEVVVKGDRFFRIYLTPKVTEVEDAECDLDTRDKESEEWDDLPSAHFFFRYILSSLADMHWSRIKGHAETDYRRFREIFGFTQPAMDRMEYYLIPCRVPEVVWDDQFDIGLDPVRNKLYAVYNIFERSLDTPGVGFLLFYRIWGYAPPMLVEGVGNYFSLSHHFTKKLIASRKWIPLNKLILTTDYRNQPDYVAFWESSSFVRFLVTTYNKDEFKTLYQKATDLTLEQDFQEVYQKDLGTLEREWLSFLEEYRDSIYDFHYAANVSFTNLHYDEAIELYQDILNLIGRDVATLRSLAYVYYVKGDFDQAENFYREILAGDTLNLEYLHTLGNIKRIKGEYDLAKDYYQKIVQLDSTLLESYIRLAEVEMDQGDLLLAEGHLEQARQLEPNTQLRAEIYLDLGSIYQKLEQPDKAEENFNSALFYARRFVGEFPGKPIPFLRLGECFFNQGEVDSAIYFYKIAEFLEERPLYQGRVSLALGKAYKEKNDLSTAERYFREVLNLPTGYKEKREAEKLLKSP